MHAVCVVNINTVDSTQFFALSWQMTAIGSRNCEFESSNEIGMKMINSIAV